LKKKDRLRKRTEYLLVQREGERIHLQDLLALCLAREGQRRLGVTASGRVGGAVERNRLRRLIREIWRTERHRLPEGYDVVFVAKRSAAGAGFHELRRQILDFGRRLERAMPGRK
jgi:ribonuclease P protein component